MFTAIVTVGIFAVIGGALIGFRTHPMLVDITNELPPYLARPLKYTWWSGALVGGGAVSVTLSVIMKLLTP